MYPERRLISNCPCDFLPVQNGAIALYATAQKLLGPSVKPVHIRRCTYFAQDFCWITIDTFRKPFQPILHDVDPEKYSPYQLKELFYDETR